MSKYQFSPHQRYAVFTCHRERCYLCREPVNLETMEVDHVIPESLLKEPRKLKEALARLGRSDNFDVNSYENWLPACGPCNQRKLDSVFEPSPIVQVCLQTAAKEAPAARRAEAELISRRQLVRAFNVLHRAAENLTDEDRSSLKALMELHRTIRRPEMAGKPMQFSGVLEVLHDDGAVKVVRGPYGVGSAPSAPAEPAFRCSTCGGTAFSGARCITCGSFDDDLQAEPEGQAKPGGQAVACVVDQLEPEATEQSRLRTPELIQPTEE